MNVARLASRPAPVVPPVVPALIWVAVLAFFFAQIEVQIEGGEGWATGLPTWRIESHWLLDIFWGGRAMTGYHAWAFPFIALFFHFPLLFWGYWSLCAQCRVLAYIMLFWILEDFLWFVINPEFGIARFDAASVPWHKHWLWFAPIEYWIYLPLAVFLLWQSTRNKSKQR
ncbi:MAG: hypothetical protein A3I66_06040 [Burkholderiales bacterium RIFCSPLOWO2_02_FULL_57_36]|nr:MAG: hypothetical protein A3I66_06040 [Burkholderiales bacterium RIFCSPLOWO2_02_FULL_57_36]